MKIKNIELKNNLIMAPMAGITDVAFRELCVDYGADYAVCEMVSAKALKYNSKKTKDLLITSPQEQIKVAQIFGSDPQIMADICKSKDLEAFDIIDINMGCPAPKIVNNKEGSALMKNLPLAKRIIEACVNATNKPITVKFRSGWDEESINAVEFAKMAEEAGASAITIHARTRQQFYSGKCDLDVIKEVVNAVNIPVIGNGDVVDKETYNNMRNYCGCSAVMVGRGALGSPWVFSEILGKDSNINLLEIIHKHITLLQKHYPDSFIVKHMRKHVLWYLKGIPGINSQKNEIVNTNTLAEMEEKIKEILKNKI